MAQREYTVEGRNFRTESDYKRALRDKEIIDRLRARSVEYDKDQLNGLLQEITDDKYKFYTMLGTDFADEIRDRIKVFDKNPKKQTGKGAKSSQAAKTYKTEKVPGTVTASKKGKSSTTAEKNAEIVKVSDAAVKAELQAQEKRRRLMIRICVAVAAVCFGYFGIYTYYIGRTKADYDELIALKEKGAEKSSQEAASEDFVIHYTDEGDRVVPDVLEEYKSLLNKNQKLIGWIKIDDTQIDYPVMQTTDNEYYLEHNLNQEYDKNGSIFMDKDCDVLKPSTNLILYGHHMKSGRMFGGLDKYSSKDYYDKHKYIFFDTIYEKGVYEVMYVFRSKVYNEEEVVFKYYQFIDALSEKEFDSNMREMAEASLYDTGVTAHYGDRLLTLSTCDYQEKDGRFVVVAKKTQ